MTNRYLAGGQHHHGHRADLRWKWHAAALRNPIGVLVCLCPPDGYRRTVACPLHPEAPTATR